MNPKERVACVQLDRTGSDEDAAEYTFEHVERQCCPREAHRPVSTGLENLTIGATKASAQLPRTGNAVRIVIRLNNPTRPHGRERNHMAETMPDR